MSYVLIGPDGRPHPSPVPGRLGGHRRGRLYGRLDCPSALRAIARGGYVRHRVFFADEATAVAAGYRPCAVCLPEEYASWKDAAPTPGEVAAMRDLLAGARTIAIGHGRDAASLAAVRAVLGFGKEVLAVVDWPETAASWLRPARRLTAQIPDAWVIAGEPAGWSGMVGRLWNDTPWNPARTFGFAAQATVDGVPPLAVAGMRGVTRGGGTWELGAGWLVER
ncbi:hypothetical protein Afil01_47940 [Actinorhabdospora filicis]|uniref:Ada DNA repair metal-binding domain-containing protein n=1 Tax=Actinorhabdospora filicis TaxID=1785913 RepID=A0A9W6W549_9ACTN|nr:Ada metal-binding domain-containing protein [Actinorhabdospora filicis]GLZ79987.1 hypothetical protein Afil01_47940 [Actinorhabdospora filicis]